jgi:NADPH:quinone reductase-like Zn-dependent oxidoreductase
MKALVRDGDGSPDVLHVRDIEVPAPKENEVLIRVHAYLSECFEAGHLVPVIDGPYQLSDARAAFRHFGAANHKGKVVILPR